MAEPTQRATGRLIVIAGCMFSGKTSWLLRRFRQDERSGRCVRAFKHAIDERYDADHLVTHNGDRFPAVRVKSAGEIIGQCDGVDTVGIDEGHFFDAGLVTVVRELREAGKVVVVSGVDLDAWGRLFPRMDDLLRIADEITYTYARCRVCGKQARISQRLVEVDADIVVGGAEMYEPRCMSCFERPKIAPPERS